MNFSGGPDLVSWLGTFTLERVVGTVPVEADGSAFFEVPADRQFFFVALDENDLSVKTDAELVQRTPGRSDQLRRLPRTTHQDAGEQASGPPARHAASSEPDRAFRRLSGRAGLHARRTADPRPPLRRVPHVQQAGGQSHLVRRSRPALVPQLLQPVRPSPGRGRSQRAWQPAAAHHRQFRQRPAARRWTGVTTR